MGKTALTAAVLDHHLRQHDSQRLRQSAADGIDLVGLKCALFLEHLDVQPVGITVDRQWKLGNVPVVQAECLDILASCPLAEVALGLEHAIVERAGVDHDSARRAYQASAPQPMRKAAPPNGVIAPSQRMSVSAIT